MERINTNNIVIMFTSSKNFKYENGSIYDVDDVDADVYRTLWLVEDETYVRVEICRPPFDFEQDSLTCWSLKGYTGEQLHEKIDFAAEKIATFNSDIDEACEILAHWQHLHGPLGPNSKWVMGINHNGDSTTLGGGFYVITQVHEDTSLTVTQSYLSIQETNGRKTQAENFLNAWTFHAAPYVKLQTVLNKWLDGHPVAWAEAKTVSLHRSESKCQEHVRLLF